MHICIVLFFFFIGRVFPAPITPRWRTGAVLAVQASWLDYNWSKLPDNAHQNTIFHPAIVVPVANGQSIDYFVAPVTNNPGHHGDMFIDITTVGRDTGLSGGVYVRRWCRIRPDIIQSHADQITPYVDPLGLGRELIIGNEGLATLHSTIVGKLRKEQEHLARSSVLESQKEYVADRYADAMKISQKYPSMTVRRRKTGSRQNSLA